MKKTLLVTLDFPPIVGGVSAYYKNLCSHLPSRDIFVLAPHHPQAAEFDRAQSYKIIRQPLLSSHPLIWPKWKNLATHITQVVKEHKIKALLVGQILPVGTVALLLKKKLRLPYYVFAHGMDITMLKGRKKLLAKTILKNSAGAIANSHFTKHQLEQLGMSHKKIETIYPCPEALPAASDFDHLRLKSDYKLFNRKILLTVGRLVERKGHDQVISVLPELIKKYNNLTYLIAGNGPMLPELQKQVKNLGLEEHVGFVTNASNSTISALYELCDIFVMPSRMLKNGDVEGFGTVFLEANMFCKPVIGGRSGGVPEAILHHKTGIIVDPHKPQELIQAILQFFEQPDIMHTYGLQGLSRVHDTFQWYRQVEPLKTLLSPKA